jgi:hypothetical protein
MKTLFAQWKEGHSIQFSHETGIFNSWYHMNNLETGDKIDTELLAEACDELALHIVEFDLYTKTITLNDGSKWIVSKKNCSHCLSRIKQRFTNKIFVTKAYKSDTFYLITSTSSLEHLEVVPAN